MSETLCVTVTPIINADNIKVDDNLDPQCFKSMKDAAVKKWVNDHRNTKMSVRLEEHHHHLHHLPHLSHVLTGTTKKRDAILHPHKFTRDSTVPLPLAATAVIATKPNNDLALSKLLRAQGQDADLIFARRHSTNTIALGPDIAEPNRVAYLLHKWAGDFANPDITRGTERERILFSGIQAFASYLERIEPGHHLNDKQVEQAQNVFNYAAGAHDASAWHEVRNDKAALRHCREEAKKKAGALKVEGATLESFRDVVIGAMRDATRCPTASAVVAMICAGTVLYSHEQAAHDAKVVGHASTALALTGAVVGFFPVYGAAVGLMAVVGTSLITSFSGGHIQRHQSIGNAALRFASAIMLDRQDGCEDTAKIPLAAFKSIEGL